MNKELQIIFTALDILREYIENDDHADPEAFDFSVQDVIELDQKLKSQEALLVIKNAGIAN
jgi:hypothetical protein